MLGFHTIWVTRLYDVSNSFELQKWDPPSNCTVWNSLLYFLFASKLFKKSTKTFHEISIFLGLHSTRNFVFFRVRLGCFRSLFFTFWFANVMHLNFSSRWSLPQSQVKFCIPYEFSVPGSVKTSFTFCKISTTFILLTILRKT